MQHKSLIQREPFEFESDFHETGFEVEPFKAYSEFEQERLGDELLEEEFRASSLPVKAQAAFAQGALFWPLAVQEAIKGGMRNLNGLTDLVFFMHHPELVKNGVGLPLGKGSAEEALRREWIAFRTLVKPIVDASSITPAGPSSKTDLAPRNLKWGVPGGRISDPFYRSKAEARQLFGIPGRADGDHYGIDVTGSNAGRARGTLHDLRRGLPVYATIKPAIPINDLNEVRVTWDRERTKHGRGLGVHGSGTAELIDALVLLQPWSPKPPKMINAWGGVLGLACRYGYDHLDRSRHEFILYIEYLHLITEKYPPIDRRGYKMASPEQWIAMGKKLGFGPRMKHRAKLSASELTGGAPLLVGYLGATVSPHVHIQASYRRCKQQCGVREQAYSFFPRLDPTVMIT